MCFRKSQIIKLEKNYRFNANLDDNEVLYIRSNSVVKRKKAYVEVPITHKALVIKGGGNLKCLDSGTYEIFDSKAEVKRWKNGMTVEVIYVPKDTRVLIKWGTPNRLRYRDEDSRKVITVGARGEFDVYVSDMEQFFRKVVGIKKEFNLDEFRRRFSETVASEFADIFLRIIEEKHLTYDKFSANKKEIGDKMGEILSPMFESQWGLFVLNFKIADFDLLDKEMEDIESVDKEIKERKKIKEYLAEIERLDDKQWEREKYLHQLELQDRSAYYEVLKVIGENKKIEKDNKCPNCGLVFKPSDKFCPHCGKRLSKEPIICPDCGNSNASTATFCANCGKNLIKHESK